jgi:DNA polymerase-1
VAEEVHRVVGHAFNLGSHPQTVQVLYQQLGLKVETFTAKGNPSTSEKALKALAQKHRVPDLILKYRGVGALLGRIRGQLLAKLDTASERVFCSFNQLGTRTGRFSCSNPNLQGIPQTSRVRQGFVAAPGFVLLDMDYSQIEPRILAQVSGDPALIAIFKSGDDIYRRIMAEIEGTSLESISEEKRNLAKRITLGIIYGMGEVSLAEQTGLSLREARRFLSRFFMKFTGVRRLQRQVVASANLTGKVKNHFGRTRKIPNLRSRQRRKRKKAQRQAFNFLIQGAAGDIVKEAMLRVNPLLSDHCRLLLQIHDELVFEVREDMADGLVTEIKGLMEVQPEWFEVPIVVECGKGKTWAEAMENSD